MGRKKLESLFPACVRYGHVKPDEEHLCYFCGEPIPVNLPYHSCGSMVMCPRCGKCGCNISKIELESLVELRDRFCCNAWHFAGGNFSDLDHGLLKLVPGFEKTLAHCRSLEWELAIGKAMYQEIPPGEVPFCDRCPLLSSYAGSKNPVYACKLRPAYGLNHAPEGVFKATWCPKGKS